MEPMKTKLQIAQLFKDTFKGWMNDDPFKQSAVVAYYAIFSLPALLVLVINIITFFFAKDIVNGALSQQLAGAMGKDTATQVMKIVQNASQSGGGLLPGILAVVMLIAGATGVFVQLQSVLNSIWGVKQKSKGAWTAIRDRLFSLGLVMSIGFLLLVSLVVSSLLATIDHWLAATSLGQLTYVMYAIDFLMSLGVISVLFALMFRFLPDVRVSWRSIWAGAILTGILFTLGKFGLSFYFGKAHPGAVYGAAGSIVLVLLWVSYSSMIVFFGAEFTKYYSFATNAKIQVTENADIVTSEAQAKLIPAAAEKGHAVHSRRQVRHLKGVDELERERNKQSLHSVVTRMQIKEMLAHLFSFKRKFHT
jgi:membrane protein